MALLRSVATVGGFTMLSRVLGLARDILIAAILGAGPVADAFFVAFRLPNFFRRLFAEGAFNPAFVPLFARSLAEGGRTAARRFAGEVMSVFVAMLFLFVTAFQIAMPWAMYGFAPGFASDPYRFGLAVTLTQITFPYLLFVSLVAQLGGVLNALDRFAAAAAAPVVLNLCLIAAVLGLSPLVETPGHALAWGVAAAGAAQFAWLVVACRRAGFSPRLPFPRLTPGVRKLLRLMLPGILAAGVTQVNLLVDVIIASLLPRGSVSYLYYADRVNQLPLGVIGVAIGTALLPLMSRQLRAGKDRAAADAMNRALEFGLLFTLPAAAALLVMPAPVVATLFERGAFDGSETAATAVALAAYATGLPAYVLIKVLGPGFFAREDTATPMKVAISCVAVNLCLNLLLMEPLQHVGIALATAVSAWTNSALLAWLLARRGHLAIDARLRRAAPRILAASAGMALVLWAARTALGETEGPQPIELAGLVTLGLASFAILAVLTGAARLADVRALLDRSRG